MAVDDITAKIANSALQPEISAVLELELPGEAYAGLDDFDVIPSDHQSFAIDGAGGWYYMLGDGRILLVDSEGLAGVVARDFRSFVATAAGLPGWRDSLRFMGASTLDAARAEWQGFVQKWNLDAAIQQPWPYYPETFSTPTPAAGRDAVLAEFATDPAADAFAALYEAVNTLNDDVSVSWQGEAFQLFGRPR